ncbi:MAG: hypothetical protein EOP53_07970 [Sphingobacteriales bacterium]|nr:MAG: hypothetical protein EOP53_07970 [Sphingobacteriales bacterium]
MKKEPKYLVKAFSVLIALLLINISISSNFSVSVANNYFGCSIAKQTPNNIESFFELLAEVTLGFEDLLPESENDNSPINEEIKVSHYIKPKLGYKYFSVVEIGREFGAYISPKYDFVFEINPPPPKA